MARNTGFADYSVPRSQREGSTYFEYGVNYSDAVPSAMTGHLWENTRIPQTSPWDKYNTSIDQMPHITYGPGLDRKGVGLGYESYVDHVLGMQSYNANYSKRTFASAPIGYNLPKAGYTGAFAQEAGLLALQQTMDVLMARIRQDMESSETRGLSTQTIESRGFSNISRQRGRATALQTRTQTAIEKVIPGLLTAAKKPTGWIDIGLLSGNFFQNVFTGEIANYWNFKKDWPGSEPELIENVIEENMSWKGKLTHGPDYQESPDTKDTTKETIKTIEATGKLITTDLGDDAFKKTKEYEKPDIEAEKERTVLEEKLRKRKQSGILLGAGLSK
jgi:hypothetical protein